jgi:PAS domain S-box-containing protein
VVRKHGVTAFLRAFKNEHLVFFDAETDWLITLDEVGRIVDVNPAFEEKLARSKAQVIYHEIIQFVSEDDLARFIHAFDKSRPSEPIHFLKRDQGDVTVTMVNFVFQKNEDDKLFGYLILRPA